MAPPLTQTVRSFGMASSVLLCIFALAIRSWPLLVATVLTICMCWRFKMMGGKRKKKGKRAELSEEEKEAIIANWEPSPLVPLYSEREQNDPNYRPRSIEGRMGKFVVLDDKNCVNLASTDFFGFIGNQKIEEVAKNAIFKYGVGSCGPRNFYGTVDVHLDLERELAEFMGCEEAILYSYGFPTIASAIPAYSRRGDVIFADKGVNFAIQSGLRASRSDILWFEHNDMADLERKMVELEEKDKMNPKRKASIRRLIVIEGIYTNSGDICPLPKLIELKWRHKVRIFIDESFSFGVLGKHGKGVTEHFGVDVVDVDLISASLENAMATTGGFCCGRSFVIGHQRLSGLGYCFSASLPPLLATAASEALRLLIAEPERIERLRSNAIVLHQLIRKALEGTKFGLISIDCAPQKHIEYRTKEGEGREIVEQKLDQMVNRLLDHGILVTRARYLLDKEEFCPKLTIKVSCRADLNGDELENLGQKLRLTFATLEF
ncbi:hypothetical protein niasHT_020555 [Heterodera trifolii]|uniref:Serine palmitoyltransferase 1 n=1 Tax=Heterodera trifolii TaxID=157864 RepID=A0ABD2J9T0_9BILA